MSPYVCGVFLIRNVRPDIIIIIVVIEGEIKQERCELRVSYVRC